MTEYPKIQSIWKRNQKGIIIEGDYSTPELAYLSNAEWIGTEKIDGTNIRVIVSNTDVRFFGRTDKDQLNPKLLYKLKELFPINKTLAIVQNACLYGEGYGGNIQKNGCLYCQNPNFILFDIKIGDYWLYRLDLEGIAEALGIMIVPKIFRGNLQEACNYVQEKQLSNISDSPLIMEGLVLKPRVQLFDRQGNRIATKIKYSDYTRLAAVEPLNNERQE